MNLAPPRVGSCLSLHYPLPPSPSPSPSPRKVHPWGIFFALPTMNGPLPAEIKFRENTGRGLLKDWKVRTNSTEGKCYSAAIIWVVITFKVSFTLHDHNACFHAPIHVYDRDVHKGACFGNYLSWIVTASVVIILLYILFFPPSWFAAAWNYSHTTVLPYDTDSRFNCISQVSFSQLVLQLTLIWMVTWESFICS